MKNMLITFTLLLLTTLISAEVVCSEDEFTKELREDIELNGKLDCLREILPPEGKEETTEERQKRIAAQWNGDCSFEAVNQGDADWFTKLQQNYGLKKGLVDVDGEPVEKSFPEQADMCELFRALIASGKIASYGDNVKTLTPDIVDHVDCAGTPGQTEVCAATASSFPDKAMWYVLIDGKAMALDGKPKFMLEESKEDQEEEEKDPAAVKSR